MKTWFKELIDGVSLKFVLFYFLKAFILLALLFAIGNLISPFGTLSVAITWAVTSALLAIALAYPQII